MKRTFALSVLLALADQAVKSIIRSQPQGTVFLTAPHLFEITHSVNTGAAFSLLSGRPMLVMLLTAALVIALAVAAFRLLRLTRAAKIAVGCLLGGGIGNLIDRLLFGAVTDYIRLLPIRFPVFNLADILITLSVAALMGMVLTGRLEIHTGEFHEHNT